MHEVLVNRLGGLSMPRKSVLRLTDRPDMTLDVYRGRKTTMQQQLPCLRRDSMLKSLEVVPFELYSITSYSACRAIMRVQVVTDMRISLFCCFISL